jgi:hypothetical protein
MSMLKEFREFAVKGNRKSREDLISCGSGDDYRDRGA